MKKYKLLHDLPTFEAGDIFRLEDCGLFNEKDGVCAYSYRTLEKFPNILEEWFEEIKEPLIKDEKIRKAIKAWAEANEISSNDKLTVTNVSKNYWFVRNTGQHSRLDIDFQCALPSELKDLRRYKLIELVGETDTLMDLANFIK